MKFGYSRRELLEITTVTATVASLAGCQENGNESESETTSPNQSTPAVNSTSDKEDPASTSDQEDTASNPLLYAATTADRIYTVNAVSGEESDIFDPSVGSIGTPLIANGMLFISDGTVSSGADGDLDIDEGSLYGLNPDSGEIEFEYSTSGAVQPPTIFDTTAYISVYTSGVKLCAVDLESNTLQWDFEQPDVYVLSQPYISDGQLFIGANISPQSDSGRSGGSLYAIDTETGEVDWEFQEPAGGVGQPIVKEGTVYAIGGDTLYAVEAGSGEIRWTYEANELHGQPKITDDVIYSAAGPVEAANPQFGYVHAVNLETGERLWIWEDAGQDVTVSTISNGLLYAPSEDGTIYSIDTDTGETEWTHNTDSSDQASVTEFDDILYLTIPFGPLRALDTATGKEEWEFDPWNDDFKSNSPTVIASSDNEYSADSRVRSRSGSHHYN